MHKIIFLIISIFPFFSFGQYTKEADIKPDIHYYHFYDNVQMVELDYLTAYHRQVNYMEQAHPRALTWEMVYGPPHPNVYIFRNRNGVIVKEYGKKDKDIKLLSVKKSSELCRNHNDLLINIGSQFGLSSIRTRFSPYYLIGSFGSNSIGSNKLGLIDSLGNVVLKKEYEDIVCNGQGFFICQKGNSFEWRDQNLNHIYKTDEYRLRFSYDKKYVEILKNKKVGLLNSEGKISVPCKYIHIRSFNEYGLAQVQDEKYRLGFVNTEGKEVIKCKYENFGKFTEGLISARLNGKRGFIDTKGKTVIPFIYDHAFWFAEGLSRVSKKIDGVYYFGYIDREGNEIIPLKYANAGDFKDGIAEVRTDFPDASTKVRPAVGSRKEKKPEREGTWMKIDKKGNKIN